MAQRVINALHAPESFLKS